MSCVLSAKYPLLFFSVPRYLIMAFIFLDLDLPFGSLHLASARTAAIIADCFEGYCYRQKGYRGYYWKCADSVFVNFDRAWSLGLIPDRKICVAKRGDHHHHGPPPRELITMMLFRWQCAIRAVELFDRRTPGEVIEEVYQEWLPNELPLPVGQTKELVSSWVDTFQKRRKLSEYDPILMKWMHVCGREALKRFAIFYRDTSCWPRGVERGS